MLLLKIRSATHCGHSVWMIGCLPGGGNMSSGNAGLRLAFVYIPNSLAILGSTFARVEAEWRRDY
jgi:hypothetical protein